MAELLFVGNTGGTLNKLATQLARNEPGWSVKQISGTDAALEYLQMRSCDLVLACLDDEPSSYQDLFKQVAVASPSAIRLALFDHADKLPQKLLHAHQHLAARDDLSYLRPILAAGLEVVNRASHRRELAEIICNLQDVPSPPTLYFDIREQLESASTDLSSMAEVTARDPSLVARILKIANSGLYALPRSVGDLSEAIGLIGTDALLGLVLAAHLYAGLPPPGLKLEVLWQHTFRVSTLAKRITAMEGGDRKTQSESAVAGLLHDIGLMVLLENQAARYQPLWRRSRGDEAALAKMERDVFGVTHGELGALILMLWSLPSEIVDAVANSHAAIDPGTSPGATLSLPSRAVLAAEWLLDASGESDLDDAPAYLRELPDATLACWRDVRDEVATQSAQF